MEDNLWPDIHIRQGITCTSSGQETTLVFHLQFRPLKLSDVVECNFVATSLRRCSSFFVLSFVFSVPAVKKPEPCRNSRSGNLALLFLLCQPSFRCKVRAKDILCTAWQRLAEVLDHFVTTIINIGTNSNITLSDHYTTDLLLTVNDKFPRPLTPARDPRSPCIFAHHDSHLAL